MNFIAFADVINLADSSVVLLEGSRTIADADKPKLIALGGKLVAAFPNVVFRSRNADGADSLLPKAFRK